MGYLGNGLTITGTQNSKRIVVDATPNQTISTVTGGYLVGQLDVYRNGVKLVDTQDYTASDGASVTFLAAASEGDELEFVVFENFDVASALSKSGGSLNGDLVVTGIATFNSDVSIGGTLTYEDVTNIDSVGLITARQGIHIGPSAGVAATLTEAGGAVFTGIVTATFSGDGTGLTGVASTDNINTSTLAQFTGGVGIADSIFHLSDDNTAIRFPAADTFTVETAGTERLRINSDGLVKVGGDETVSAATGIQIQNAGAALLTLLRNDLTISDGNTLGGIDFYGNDGGSVEQVAKISAVADGTHGDSDKPTALVFQTTNDGAGSATEKLRISNSGRVGIGTDNPLDELHVNSSSANVNLRLTRDLNTGARITGSDGASPAFIVETIASGTATERLRVDSDGDVGIGTNSIAFSNGTGLEIVRSGTACVRIEGNGGNHALEAYADSNGATLDARGSSANLMIDTGGTERFRIASSGQIGLGGANYGTSGQVIVSNGSGSAPTWQTLDTGGITTHVGTASGIVTSLFLNDATDHKVTVTGFVTFTATQSGTEGQSHTIRIVNSGIATVGFSTYFLFPSGSTPVLPTADGAVSLISFTIHDSVGAGCTQLLAGASLNFS